MGGNGGLVPANIQIATLKNSWQQELTQREIKLVGQWLYKSAKKANKTKKGSYSVSTVTALISFSKNGAGTRNRTRDTRIFSPLLYRLSYPGTFLKKLFYTRSAVMSIALSTLEDFFNPPYPKKFHQGQDQN
jgi:hypothetical protein